MGLHAICLPPAPPPRYIYCIYERAYLTPANPYDCVFARPHLKGPLLLYAPLFGAAVLQVVRLSHGQVQALEAISDEVRSIPRRRFLPRDRLLRGDHSCFCEGC